MSRVHLAGLSPVRDFILDLWNSLGKIIGLIGPASPPATTVPNSWSVVHQENTGVYTTLNRYPAGLGS